MFVVNSPRTAGSPTFSRWDSARGALNAVLAILVFTVFSVVAQPYGLEQRSPIGPFLNNVLPPIEQASALAAVVAFPNLTFDNAVGLTPEPGTNRLYVCERDGKIFSFPNLANTTHQTLFLDPTGKTQGYNDSGLLG